MRYPIHNKKAYLCLLIVDTFLASIFFWKKKKELTPPQKILICNSAHLGDIILSTALLPLLKNAFPNAILGMIVSKSSSVVVKNHPLLNHLHTCDHWKTNRSSLSFFRKYYLYLKSSRQALHEIKKIGYHAALDLKFHYPNFAPLLWKAKIPQRLGFSSAGLSSFLTHTLPWHANDLPAVESFFQLASLLKKMNHNCLKPTLATLFSKKEEYVVIHPGTGDPKKAWPTEKWKTLTQELSRQGYTLLFTGKGIEEHKIIHEITKELTNFENLADTQNWNDFVATIGAAKFLITVDSAAAHVASCTETPTFIISTRINPLKIWSPQGKNIHLIYHSPPCASCLKGCATMHCIQEISPSEVLYTFNSVIKAYD